MAKVISEAPIVSVTPYMYGISYGSLLNPLLPPPLALEVVRENL